MIELRHVSKAFSIKSGEVVAVSDVNLTIDAGDIFGIIGYSGAGKSSLVRCINLLETPDSGQVVVAGKDLSAMKPRELRKARRKIGMIFQHFYLLRARTVFQNIAYPLKGSGLSSAQIASKVRGLIALVGLEDKETAYPAQLSGGQKQRVAIARALANDPDVLLCDEATSALDPKSTMSILKLIKQLNEELGLTVVIITHEMSVVKEICNRVAIMQDGRVAEEGDVFSVFANPREAITQEFIATTSNLHKIFALIEEKSPVAHLEAGQRIVLLRYLSPSASTPLVSYMSRQFGIDVNIIFGDIEIVQSAPLGGLVAIFSGEAQGVDGALAYLAEQNVQVEVLAHG